MPKTSISPKVDLRDTVPQLAPYLQPGDQVVKVEELEITHPTRYPSALKALEKLTNVKYLGEHDQVGPVMAARSTTANSKVSQLHLFEILFGRDAERVALDLLDQYPGLAKATIIKLAELQGYRKNRHSAEEPGRIIHEYRDPKVDKIARQLTAELGWQWPYFGAIDSTPMYITLVKRYCKQEGDKILSEVITGRDGKSHTVNDAVMAALKWLLARLDRSEVGLLEYRRILGDSAETWKDSWDSFSHHDGRIANHDFGVASVDVQALAYDALLDAVHLFPDMAEDLYARAELLNDTVMKRFWHHDKLGGYFVIGLDHDSEGRLRQLDIKTSDMGHLLNSRLLDGDDKLVVERREAIIRHLFAPDLLAVSGIRTLATDEVRYCPGGYHTGSVWLWDTYYIAQGLERQGYYGLSHNLKERIWRVARITKKFPEFARGDGKKPALTSHIVDVENADGRIYRLEQPPQEIQAWTVAAILESKTKHDPLNPKKLIPTEARDPAKRRFEKEILKQANLVQ
jgi:glycogen debranching enzyme